MAVTFTPASGDLGGTCTMMEGAAPAATETSVKPRDRAGASDRATRNDGIPFRRGDDRVRSSGDRQQTPTGRARCSRTPAGLGRGPRRPRRASRFRSACRRLIEVQDPRRRGRSCAQSACGKRRHDIARPSNVTIEIGVLRGRPLVRPARSAGLGADLEAVPQHREVQVASQRGGGFAMPAHPPLVGTCDGSHRGTTTVRSRR